MQDRFRFRFWLEEEHRWFYFGFETFLTYQKQIEKALDNGLKICQSVGLKDKNGKLIYEGDILLSPDGDYPYRVLVDWFDAEAKFVVNAWNGKEFEYLLSDDEPQDLENFEVIGNIYEDKDLLKEGKE